MKQLIRLIATATITSLIMTANIKAQSSEQSLSLANAKSKDFAGSSNVKPSSVFNGGKVGKAKTELKASRAAYKTIRATSRAQENFNRSFSNVASVDWDVQKTVIAATFFTNGNRIMVVYDNAGRWVHNLSYLKLSEMPKSVKSMITYMYPDYEIRGLIEVKENRETFYMLSIENNKWHKQVAVYHDELVLIKEFMINK